MKMKITFKNHWSVAVALAVITLFTFAGCKKNPVGAFDPTRRAQVSLTGGQEVPANASTGTGYANVAYDPITKTISYDMSWELGFNTSMTNNMHFHGAENASDFVSSPVIIGITGFTTNYKGTIQGTTRALTAAEEAQLLAGKWYLNIHSNLISAGELRGNIKFKY
jgi:hypothetical protein